MGAFMRLILTITLPVLFFAATAFAGEEGGGEHEVKKEPPKLPAGSPMETVGKLPVVAAWSKWVASYRGSLDIWGESLNTIDEHKCWGVAVGEAPTRKKPHVWKRFCVPADGGDPLVETMPDGPGGDAAYIPYDKWVEKCKPTETSEGAC
jgi:hypothetical protein